MSEKHCPILIPLYHQNAANWDETVCLELDCAWWNEDFDCCGLIVQGAIWGLETARKESHEGQDH